MEQHGRYGYAVGQQLDDRYGSFPELDHRFPGSSDTEARQAGISFVITGGAESGYHASGIYSHENGYKVDISDDGIYQGTKAYEVLINALSPYKHQITHEWDKNHYDITIYPENYNG